MKGRNVLSLSHLRTCLTASFIATAMVACGGGGSSGVVNAEPTSDPFANDPQANRPIVPEILGSDTDLDGIEDDLQEYVQQNYATESEQMRAVKRMAIVERRAFSVFHDVNALSNIAAEKYHATGCWIESMRNDEDPLSNEEQEYISQRIAEYERLTRNTPDRDYFMNVLDVRLARIYGDPSFSKITDTCE